MNASSAARLNPVGGIIATGDRFHIVDGAAAAPLAQVANCRAGFWSAYGAFEPADAAERPTRGPNRGNLKISSLVLLNSAAVSQGVCGVLPPTPEGGFELEAVNNLPWESVVEEPVVAAAGIVGIIEGESRSKFEREGTFEELWPESVEDAVMRDPLSVVGGCDRPVACVWQLTAGLTLPTLAVTAARDPATKEVWALKIDRK